MEAAHPPTACMDNTPDIGYLMGNLIGSIDLSAALNSGRRGSEEFPKMLIKGFHE